MLHQPTPVDATADHTDSWLRDPKFLGEFALRERRGADVANLILRQLHHLMSFAAKRRSMTKPVAVLSVFELCAPAQMARIAAKWIGTVSVKGELALALGRSECETQGKPMSENLGHAYIEAPVAIVQPAKPGPALVFSALGNLRPKAALVGFGKFHAENHITYFVGM